MRTSNGTSPSIVIDKGYFGSSELPGLRVLETNHSITITGLEPATTYYYCIASWIFADSENQKVVTDPNGNPLIVLEYVNSITTKSMPTLVIHCKRTSMKPAKGVPLKITKDGIT